MLGQDLVARVRVRHTVFPSDIGDTDITVRAQVSGLVQRSKPDVVIHTAAFTAVDECENQRDLAFAVNAEGTRNLALACSEFRIPLLYISTDYVFNGEKPTPYVEEDATGPLNVYGQSKLRGEEYVKELLDQFWIVRTSWLFGPLGKNFVRAILQKARREGQLRVVDDQVGAPTYTEDLAEKLEEIAGQTRYGFFHVTNQGYCSWFQFAQEIVRQAGLRNVEITPIPTSEAGRPAPRAKNSRLENGSLSKKGIALLPPWQDALRRYLLRTPEDIP